MSATITVPSASAPDFQTALAIAVSGDTINLLAGLHAIPETNITTSGKISSFYLLNLKDLNIVGPNAGNHANTPAVIFL